MFSGFPCTVTKFLVTVKIANSVGAVNETTLYDLKVFNYLVMRLDTHTRGKRAIP